MSSPEASLSSPTSPESLPSPPGGWWAFSPDEAAEAEANPDMDSDAEVDLDMAAEAEADLDVAAEVEADPEADLDELGHVDAKSESGSVWTGPQLAAHVEKEGYIVLPSFMDTSNCEALVQEIKNPLGHP